jgi:hypothetical protein
MQHFKSTTQRAMDQAFGYPVDIISSEGHIIHGERRRRYTCRRPNGKKMLHAMMMTDGSVIVLKD